jgi:hypothetical protein
MTDTINTTSPKPKKTKFKPMAKEDIYAYAIYEAYEDYDNMFSILQFIIADMEKDDFSKYQVRNALKAMRTLMIANQSAMMDIAGLEY